MVRYGDDGFTSPPKEAMLQFFITLENPSSLALLNPRTLGPAANTIPTEDDIDLLITMGLVDLSVLE
jgi:hypothetical protein